MSSDHDPSPPCNGEIALFDLLPQLGWVANADGSIAQPLLARVHGNDARRRDRVRLGVEILGAKQIVLFADDSESGARNKKAAEAVIRAAEQMTRLVGRGDRTCRTVRLPNRGRRPAPRCATSCARSAS